MFISKMAETPVSPRLPASPNVSSGQLASCKGVVYILKGQTWDPLFGNNIYKLHLVRQGGNFILFVVDDQRNLVVRIVNIVYCNIDYCNMLKLPLFCFHKTTLNRIKFAQEFGILLLFTVHYM